MRLPLENNKSINTSASTMSIGIDTLSNFQCRVCLSFHPTMFSLFDDNKYSLKMTECTNIKIIIGDGLPNGICEKCLKILPVAHEFVIKCRETDEKLKQYSDKGLMQTSEKDALYIPDIDIKHEPLELPYVELTINNISPQMKSHLGGDDYPNPLSIKDEKDEDFSDNSIGHNYDENLNKRSKKNKKLNHRKKIKNKISQPYKALQCSVCGLTVYSPSAMIIHNRTHTGDRPYSCNECGKTFGLKGTLKAHIVRFHTSVGRMFVCETCGKQFYRKKELTVHMRLHTGETPYACKFCPKSFSQHATLTRHIRTHTGEKPFPCKICGKRFAGKSMLKTHNLVHTKEKQFICNICGRALKSKDTLAKHQFVHIGTKNNVCDHCGMAFVTKGNLKLHVTNVHSSKSGQCSVCRKQCSNLEDHMRNHTGEKPFECQKCGKRFSHKHGLSMHINNHENAEKFPCSIDNCKKTFHIKSMLDFHVLKYHKNHTPHVCNECSKGFFRQSDLTRHQTLNHGDKKIIVATTKE